MTLSQKKLSKLKVEAIGKAEEIVEKIFNAYHNPQVSLSGEALRVWEELDEWDWFIDHPLDDISNRSLYQRMIAMTQFRHLRWIEENPPSTQRKLSKWEKVTGKISR